MYSQLNFSENCLGLQALRLQVFAMETHFHGDTIFSRHLWSLDAAGWPDQRYLDRISVFCSELASSFKADRPSFPALKWALITSSAAILLCDHRLGEYWCSSSCNTRTLRSTGRPWKPRHNPPWAGGINTVNTVNSAPTQQTASLFNFLFLVKQLNTSM